MPDQRDRSANRVWPSRSFLKVRSFSSKSSIHTTHHQQLKRGGRQELEAEEEEEEEGARVGIHTRHVRFLFHPFPFSPLKTAAAAYGFCSWVSCLCRSAEMVTSSGAAGSAQRGGWEMVPSVSARSLGLFAFVSLPSPHPLSSPFRSSPPHYYFSSHRVDLERSQSFVFHLRSNSDLFIRSFALCTFAFPRSIPPTFNVRRRVQTVPNGLSPPHQLDLQATRLVSVPLQRLDFRSLAPFV